MKRTRGRNTFVVSMIGICLIGLLVGCSKTSKDEEQRKATFLAMGGVPVDIIAGGIPQDRFDASVEDARKNIEKWEQELSFFRPDSGINRLSESPGQPMQVSDTLMETLLLSKKAYETTRGAFDVTVGPVIHLWKSAEKENRMPQDEEITACIAKTGFDKIRIDEAKRSVTITVPGISIDIGGIAKGLFAEWICRRITSELTTAAVPLPSKLIINPGGDMFCASEGDNVFCEIGIQNPFGAGLWGKLLIADGSVVTSGTYQRHFEILGKKYCHIVDPRTGRPIDTNLVSVTIFDPSGAMADALATSVFVLGEAEAWNMLKSRPQTLMVVIRKDGSWDVSPMLKSRLTVF